MNFADFNGQTLDDKYRIERELGKGGMGTVYLATHVGTERPVAVKIIAPQFMERAEFVERFRREARAAGRLRHPNVVNVTDFGFAATRGGEVAYLVMEYLDGCTLGEILEEEGKLPLAWSLDILEQVCSAVHEAHGQGIIHRDLKPDNIWLEPNQRGGYTVKVLDFGIAKLEEQISDAVESAQVSFSTAPIENFSFKSTIASRLKAGTFGENFNRTAVSESSTAALSKNIDDLNSESSTLIQPLETDDSESGTKILPLVQTETVLREEADGVGTKILAPDDNNATKLVSEQIATGKSQSNSSSTSDLTRVGAVLGTPLYMSPEQCRGEKLSPRSDVYSLGVIAYQMLSGKTPFAGDYKSVMKAHEEAVPPALEAKKVPKKIKQVINFALAKNAEQRPLTAQSFAAELRAQSEGIGTLFRRALEIYGKHLPKFLLLAVIFFSPLALLTVLQVVVSFSADNEILLASLKSLIALGTMFASFTCGSLLVGASTWVVAQILAYPLKPVAVRPALRAVGKKWKKLAGTSLLLSVLELIGFAFCLIPGVILSVFWALASAIVMMENIYGFAALKRSKMLVKRSLRTTFALTLITFFIPLTISLSLAYFARLAVQDISAKVSKIAIVKQAVQDDWNETAEGSGKTDDGKTSVTTAANTSETVKQTSGEDKDFDIKVNPGKNVEMNFPKEDSENEDSRLKSALSEALQQIIFLPISIVLVSFFTIVGALLYFKSRQAGGESMQDLLAQFEESEQPRSNWQKSIRRRLEQSGKQTSKS